MSGVICDRSIAVKGKVFKTVVRPAVIYGLEAMALTKTQAVELEVLRLSLVVARMDMIRNWTKDVEHGAAREEENGKDTDSRSEGGHADGRCNRRG